MKQFQIIYLAPSLGGGILVERAILSGVWFTPEDVVLDLKDKGGFKNELTGKYVAWPAVLEIDAIS